MPESVLVALVSAGTGALIVLIGNIITQIILIIREKEKEEKHDRDSFLAKKEEAYINALDILLFIKRGFDITKEQLKLYPNLSKEMSEKSRDLNDLSPKIKLYASDSVFNSFNALKDQYQKYSFANEEGWRLFEDSKADYLNKVNNLSRLMREDLGFRKLEK